MDLRHCQIWSYRPEDDDLLLEDESDELSSDSEDDEDGVGVEEGGTLWSVNYFFYNKSKKRVAYLHLKCCARKVVVDNGSVGDLGAFGSFAGAKNTMNEEWGGMEDDMEMDDEEYRQFVGGMEL